MQQRILNPWLNDATPAAPYSSHLRRSQKKIIFSLAMKSVAFEDKEHFYVQHLKTETEVFTYRDGPCLSLAG